MIGDDAVVESGGRNVLVTHADEPIGRRLVALRFHDAWRASSLGRHGPTASSHDANLGGLGSRHPQALGMAFDSVRVAKHRALEPEPTILFTDGPQCLGLVS